MKIRILVIDDELGRLEHKRREFLRAWALPAVEYTIITSQRHSSGRIDNDAGIAVDCVAADPGAWALVLLDMQFDHGPLLEGEPLHADSRFGLEIQRELELAFPGLPIVQFTAQAQSDLPVQDGRYLSKLDGTPDDLRLALVSAGRISLAGKAALLNIPDDTIVASAATVSLYADVFRRARAGAPLLIRGETGTGKEHLARYFHSISRRKDGPFLALQVSSIPASLYESELFGHEKGAFTGADKSRPGAFERAAGGTLFLDEIGSLPPELQAKLLRVIGERRFRRLGALSDTDVSCSIVSAAQDDLDALGFRKDLLARFSTVFIPALAQRPEELPVMAQKFLDMASAAHEKKGLVFSAQALAELAASHFPDNARGLRRAIDHAVMQLSSHSVIQPSHLPKGQPGGAAGEAPKLLAGLSPSAGTSLLQVLQLLPATCPPDSSGDLNGALKQLDQAVAQVRMSLAMAALAYCRHPVSGKLKVLPAMQLLQGDQQLSSANARRLLNSLRGRAQNAPVDTEELHSALDEWQRKESERRGTP